MSLLASFCLSDHTRPSTQVPRHLKYSSNMQANKMQQERHVPGAAFASPGRGSVSLGPPRRRSGCPAAHVAVRRFRLAPRRGSASSTVQLGPALTERSPASAASSRPMKPKRPAGPAGPPRPGTAGLVTRQQQQLIGTGVGGGGHPSGSVSRTLPRWAASEPSRQDGERWCWRSPAGSPLGGGDGRGPEAAETCTPDAACLAFPHGWLWLSMLPTSPCTFPSQTSARWPFACGDGGQVQNLRQHVELSSLGRWGAEQQVAKYPEISPPL